MAKKADVLMPYSKFKHNLAKVLQKEGWIASLDVVSESRMKMLIIGLKYTQDGMPAITGLKRISKPGQRIYAGNTEIPNVRSGMGITIISTSKGLMTDKIARKEKVGGEVVCQIW
jgi:small subunit ribosomal protein S8